MSLGHALGTETRSTSSQLPDAPGALCRDLEGEPATQKWLKSGCSVLAQTSRGGEGPRQCPGFVPWAETLPTPQGRGEELSGSNGTGKALSRNTHPPSWYPEMGGEPPPRFLFQESMDARISALPGPFFSWQQFTMQRGWIFIIMLKVATLKIYMSLGSLYIIMSSL